MLLLPLVPVALNISKGMRKSKDYQGILQRNALPCVRKTGFEAKVTSENFKELEHTVNEIVSEATRQKLQNHLEGMLFFRRDV